MQSELILPRGYSRTRRIQCAPMSLGLGLSLSAGGVSGSPVIPFPSLPSPLLVMRADVATTGSTFTWTDQAGTFGNATQSSGPSQPTINASDANFNGKPTLSFNGTSAYLVTSNAVTLAQPFTFYCVARWTNPGGSVALFDQQPASAFHILVGNTATHWYANATASITSSVTTNTAPMVFACVFNTVSSALYINSSVTPVATGTLTGAFAATKLIIGALSGGASQWFGGQMADLCCYGAAHTSGTSGSIGQFFAYAGNRYNQAWS